GGTSATPAGFVTHAEPSYTSLEATSLASLEATSLEAMRVPETRPKLQLGRVLVWPKREKKSPERAGAFKVDWTRRLVKSPSGATNKALRCRGKNGRYLN